MTCDSRVLSLLLRYEEARAQGQSVTPHELCSDCPELLAEVERRIQDLHELDQRLGSTDADEFATHSAPADWTGPVAEAAPGKLRYRPVRLHARGGLGEVLLAQDGELPRPVALKRMRPLSLIDPGNRRRFLLEAEVTAQLEHPGVVPVYGLVQDDAGRLCYAMRFVQGETFKDAIDRFHKAEGPGRDPGERRLAFRQLLQRFVAVCNTIGYAHSRDILHRDVKPGNIMLGQYGEALVVDWGLAKLLSAPDPVGVVPASGSGGSPDGSTEMGQAMGTPVYASPEQAGGRWDQVGPGSDLYSLGATLYMLLTGQPPFAGRTTAELLERVQRGLLLPPRRVNKDVPPALEAVCLKAMALKPEDRYAKALDLAADIEHWLADEPVSVYREPAAERLARWARRHRTWVQAAAAVLVAVSVVSAVAALLVNQARKQAEAARAAEAAAKAEANRRFEQALTVIDTWTTGADEVLKRYPVVQDVREQLLAEAARQYEQLVRERGDDPQLRAGHGHALVRLGNIYLKLGRNEQAGETYRRAEAVFAELVEQAPEPEYRLGLANARTRLAIVHKNLGRHGDAAEALRAARGDLEALVGGHPDRPEYHDALGVNLILHGELLAVANDSKEAAARLRQAAAEFEGLATAHPEVARYRQALAAARNQLGRALAAQGQAEQAIALHSQEVAAFDTLVEDSPQRRDYREDRALSRIHLANALRPLGRDEEEARAYQEAIADYEAVKNRPGVDAELDENLALTRIDLSQVLWSQGRTAEAKQQAEVALNAVAVLRKTYPEVPGFRQEWAAGQEVLGLVLADLGDNAAAEQALRDAVRTFSELVAKHSDELAYVERLAVNRGQLGRVLRKLGRPEEAQTAYQEAIDHFRKLLNEDEPPHRYLNGAAWAYTYLADLLWETNQREEAAKAYAQAREHRQRLVRDFPQAEYLHSLSWFLTDCPLSRPEDYAQAVQAARAATEQAPRYAVAWNSLGAAYYRAGAWQASIEALTKATSCRLHDHARDSFFLAMAHWQKGDKEQAQKHYERGTEWMARNLPDNSELKRLRAEAARLLGLPAPAK